MSGPLCTACNVRVAKPRYTRCARCRGVEYDTCECGAQKTKKALRCKDCHARTQSGEGHNCWKGGRVETKDGYIRLYAPDHPRRVNNRYMLEHIVVMERTLGRYLYPDERVHHKNKIRNDNTPENLELWSVGHPSGARAEDLLVWAQEIVERYQYT